MDMARKSKKPELYEKLWKRSAKDTVEERDAGYGRIKDYYNNKKVEVRWNYNQAMIDDSLFMLKVDGKEVVLDAEEVTKFLRWV